MKGLSLLAGLAFIAQMLAAVALHAAPLSAGDVPTVMINGHEAAANRVIVQFKDNATQGDASLAKLLQFGLVETRNMMTLWITWRGRQWLAIEAPELGENYISRPVKYAVFADS